MLSLARAAALKMLDAFIVQEEARGIGPIDRAEFEGAVAEVIKAPRPANQTSRSASDENSNGTRTRRDSDQDAPDMDVVPFTESLNSFQNDSVRFIEKRVPVAWSVQAHSLREWSTAP